MGKLNRNSLAIMKLLYKNPKGLSGYMIKQRFTNMSYCNNTCNNSAIYPVLHCLQKNKYLSSTIDKSSGKRKKTIWTLTQEGREAFKDWLKEPVRLGNDSEEVILKLVAGDKKQVATLLEHLEDYIIQIDEAEILLGEIAADIETFYDNPDTIFFTDLNLDFSLQVLHAKRKWADSAIRKIKSKKLA